MSLTITRHEDGNDRHREGRDGRIRQLKSPRVVWEVRRDGEFIEEFDRLKDAKAKYPEATNNERRKPSRKMAITFLVDCISQNEADGYQQCEDAAWQDFIEGWSHDESGITVVLGGIEFSFRVSQRSGGSK